MRVGFLARVHAEVAGRFESLTGLKVVTVPVSQPNADEPPLPVPVHPTCKTCEAREECPETGWAKHLERLREAPTTHWHRCRMGFHCGVVPVLAEGHVVAACKLVCRQSDREEAFRRYLDLLDILSDSFSHRAAELPSRATLGPDAVGDALAELPRPNHPQIRKAVEFIADNLTNPELSVGHVAEYLDMNPTYLGHIFVDQLGMSIRRFIAKARVCLARQLLVETDWQIKRIAFETGHRNTDWFSHVFHAETGLPPRKYRLRCRRDAASGAGGNRADQ